MLLLLHLLAKATLPTNHIGNALTRNVCLRHKQSQFCWEPLYNPDYTRFWSQASPNLKHLSLPETPAYDSVVHIRCGDVLVSNTSRWYQPACLSCFKAQLNWLGKNNILVIAGGHGRSAQTDSICASLLSVYTRALESIGRPIAIRMNMHHHEDFAILHRAKRVLTVMPSSFAFSAKMDNLSGLRMLTPKCTNGYVIRPVGNCGGLPLIETPQECASAAKALNISSTAPPAGTLTSAPIGCFFNADTNVLYFNNNGDRDSKDKVRVSLCKCGNTASDAPWLKQCPTSTSPSDTHRLHSC